jgi:hypothetical protein
VVVRGHGRPLSLGEHLVDRIERQAHRGYAHRRPVAPAVVGTHRRVRQPAGKPQAVPATRIAAAEVAERLPVVPSVEDRGGDRGGEHRVVGEGASFAEQRELRALAAVELEHGPDHVAGDRADHAVRPPVTWSAMG